MKVFKYFLVNDYRRSPGAYGILTGACGIVKCFGQEGLALTQENWSEAVLPNTNLVLFTLITSIDRNHRLQYSLCSNDLVEIRTLLWFVVSSGNRRLSDIR